MVWTDYHARVVEVPRAGGRAGETLTLSFAGGSDARPGLAIEADLTLPSGIERRGFKNRVDAGFTALLKKDVKQHSFHVNAGLDWTRDENEEESLRRGAWSVAIGHHAALARPFVLVSDLVWRQADDTHTTGEWLIETGARSQLTRKLIGAIGIGAGLNRGADIPRFTRMTTPSRASTPER